MERERISRLPPREVTDGLLRPLLEGGVVAKQPISILEQRLGRKGFLHCRQTSHWSNG